MIINRDQKNGTLCTDLGAYNPDETEIESFSVSSLAFSSPEIFESQCYPKVLTLIFLLATVPIGYFLWFVWLGGTSNLVGSMYLIYALIVQLATHAFVLVIFIALCLYLHCDDLPPLLVLSMRVISTTALCLYLHFNCLPPLLTLSISYCRVYGKIQIIIQNCLWGFWIGFMIAGLVAFNQLFIHKFFLTPMVIPG